MLGSVTLKMMFVFSYLFKTDHRIRRFIKDAELFY